MRRIGTLADRLLARLVPAAGAAAGTCGNVSCAGGGFKWCCTTTTGTTCTECG
ncbi:hypothetical protein [Phytomonospora endophytica]|uniref:Uncharacterized protein n=1 Tax=Phytomonospora endophytica TaxID=714109 RepID=A0A841FGF4_9ACTN|nr:hypothetical protein [Phytomonospora endophytica]MBB6032632.1 hypothetical protein [Phytomonospora endophytica]GIG66218.1 hypothetical protein Pen01_25130 [Phytomonospora endophytica]